MRSGCAAPLREWPLTEASRTAAPASSATAGGSGGTSFIDDCPSRTPLLAIKTFGKFASESQKTTYGIQGYCRVPPYPQPPEIKSFAFDRPFARPGDNVQLKVELAHSAGKNEDVLLQRLEVTGPSPFEGMPYNPTIPVGTTLAAFPIRISAGTPASFNGVRATMTWAPGLAGGSRDARIQVVPENSIQISAMTLSPAMLFVGGSLTVTVTIDRPAPAGGFTVGIARGGSAPFVAPPKVAGIQPASYTILIPAGATTGSVSLQAISATPPDGPSSLRAFVGLPNSIGPQKAPNTYEPPVQLVTVTELKLGPREPPRKMPLP